MDYQKIEKTALLGRRVRNILVYGFLTFWGILVLFPFYWMLLTSFKTYGEAIQVPPTLWPRNFTTEAYYNIFHMGISFWQYASNSIIVTCGVIVLQCLVMIPAAYSFAKRQFIGKGIAWAIVISALMIPGTCTYVPIYMMMAKAGLIPSLWPQIIPHGCNVFGIFMLRQAFKQIPDELIESARLDSATELQIVTRIMLPMAKASMVTIAMFSFIGTWNSYFWPKMISKSDASRTIAVGVQQLKNTFAGLIIIDFS